MVVNRWKASGIHFSICIGIALSVLSLMLLIWYPHPYFDAMGGGKLALIIIGVDVVIGPLITLIIYNPAKKELKFDLAVVALLQLSALVYGVSVVYQARPVYLVFTKDRFEVVAANDFDPTEQQKITRVEYKTLPIDGPTLVAVDTPTDPKERERILFASVSSGYDLQNFPQYYVPYQERTKEVLAKAKPILDLRKKRPAEEMRLTQLEQEFRMKTESLLFLPVRAKQQDLTAIIEKSTGKLLKLIPVDPWI
jgi:hypothetical protein